MNKMKQSLQTILKSFVFFGRAFKNAKKDFWISIQVLFWVSLALSILFYFVEHAAQPEEYRNWWQAFVWTLTRYIGDPGHFSGNGPLTLVGRHIDSFIGIMKILIFAVPAGLVANGFRKAMEDDRKEKHLQECREKILKSFKRVRNPETGYRVAPRNVSLASLAVKKSMTENDIIETVSRFDEFRLRNIADTQTRSEHPQDRLVIELLPLYGKTVDGYEIVRKSYGIMIKRQSNVTIVAPTADNENTIGHFAYNLAQFGGFNLMSRLFVTDVDDRTSFVTIEEKEEDWEIPLKDFVQDLKELSAPKESWNIVVSATKKAPDAHVHFAHKNKAGQSMTTLDEEKLQKLYEDLSCRLQEKHEILSDIDNNEFLPVGKKNISVRAGGGNTNNAFLMRLSYSLITWTDRWTPVIVDMAGIMRNHLEKPERRQLFAQDSDTWREMVSSWKMKGVGFGDGEMLEVPEVTNRKRQ